VRFTIVTVGLDPARWHCQRLAPMCRIQILNTSYTSSPSISLWLDFHHLTSCHIGKNIKHNIAAFLFLAAPV
jgi:hypothetical protein